MGALKNTLLVLSTGYILMYFSEHLFWARVRPEDSLAGWLATWAAYSLVALVFLWTLAAFRVRGPLGVFLAGAVVGWLAEGLVVQTAYEDLPLSLSWTGLAWHATLSALVGWWALQRALRVERAWESAALSALVGLGAGLWALSLWVQEGGGVTPLGEYALFSLVTGGLAALAYGLAGWSAALPFAPGRAAVGVVSVLFGLYFLLVAVPAAPLALPILPALLGLAYLGLWRGRGPGGPEPGEAVLERLRGPVPAWRLAHLLLIPAVSVAVYALALALELRLPTHWAFYLVLTPLGFGLFAAALWRAWRGNLR